LKIDTKKESLRLAREGFFGNRLLSWENLEEFLSFLKDHQEFESKDFSLRTASKPGRLYPNYCGFTSAKEIEELAKLWVRDYGCSLSEIQVYEAAPKDSSVLQGEFYNSYQLYDLTYSLNPLPLMREAFKDNVLYSSGLKAYYLLKSKMDLDSWENFSELLNLFPDSVFEFTVFDRELGSHLTNTIIWEIRNY